MDRETAKSIVEKVSKDYDSISTEFHQTRQHSWPEFNQILPYLKNHQKILDIGCGNGRFLKFLKEEKIDSDYKGVDISPKLLEQAKKSLGESMFLEGSFLKLPVETNSKDLVVSIAAFHHLPSKEYRQKALQEIRRVLSENGLLFITVWNLFQPKYKKYIWQSRIRHIYSLGKYDSRDTFIPWSKSGIKRYYYAFTSKEIKTLLQKNGFEIIEEKSGHNLTFVCRKK